jgi:nitrite reductase/ring-hydroxylating ferredoxin subunit
MAWIKIAREEDFEGESMKVFMLDGWPVIVSKIDGKFYAVSAICTHMYAYLPSGTAKDGTITCPVHGAQYDLKTGKVVRNVSEPVKKITGKVSYDLNSYDVDVSDGDILVNMPAPEGLR